MQFRRVHFDFAGGQLRIRFLTLNYIAFDTDDKFAARVFGFCVRFGLGLFVEHHLNDSGAITHVEEQQIAEVPAPRHPAEYDGRFASVGCAQRSAVVSAFQITEKVQHDSPLQ